MRGSQESLISLIMRPLLNAVYPVGSVYISFNGTDPGLLFGGTWRQTSAGRVLVGAWTGDSDFSQPYQYGGEKEHTLTTAEMPVHNHGYDRAPLWCSEQTERSDVLGSDGSLDTYIVANCGYAGGGQPHNNMPPYIVCYIWERIG